MKTKMFGYRSRKHSDSARTPGEPWNDSDYDKGNENEESSKYVRGKDYPQKEGRNEVAKDNPSNYEGREHVKYKNPGYSRHNIRMPQDEPHMKSHVSREEAHEMEDNFHMKTPDQTKYDLEKKLKRARMKMDAPDQEEPDVLRGNMVHNVPYRGEEDTSGEEEEGPNHMQSGISKERRKKMIVAVAKRKMMKKE